MGKFNIPERKHLKKKDKEERKANMIEFGGISVSVRGINSVPRKIQNLGFYAPVSLDYGDRKIVVRVELLDPACKMFASFGTEGTTSEAQNKQTVQLRQGDPFTFEIPVRWVGKGNQLPFTRKEPWDNFRVVELGEKGVISQMEIGVATREDKVFLTVQKQFQGAIVAKEGDIDVVPSYAPCAYPGFPGYRTQWSGLITHIKARMSQWGIKPATAQPEVEWGPLTKNPYGEDGATVLFFSPVGGTGRLLWENEEALFVHFNAIKEINDGLALAPMTWVRVTDFEDPRPGHKDWQATEITL